MGEFLNLRDLTWTLTLLLEAVLFFHLFGRKLHRSHPAFFLYVLAAIVQSLLLAFVYSHWASRSLTAWYLAWGSQGMILCIRWLAVAEIARRILARYTGIWKMASGILLILSACVLAYAVTISELHWDLLVLTADRAMEMCIALFIVTMLLFARYYRIAVPNLERLLAIGFCLYSSFHVINDSLYEGWQTSLGSLWSYLDVLTFLASLLLWINAVRLSPGSVPAKSETKLTAEQYELLSHKLDSRLQALNNRLNHLLRTEDPRS